MKRNLECAICGADAGTHEQWHNQDTGFGVCPRCVGKYRNGDNPRAFANVEEFDTCYGKPGVNYGMEAAK